MIAVSTEFLNPVLRDFRGAASCGVLSLGWLEPFASWGTYGVMLSDPAGLLMLSVDPLVSCLIHELSSTRVNLRSIRPY